MAERVRGADVVVASKRARSPLAALLWWLTAVRLPLGPNCQILTVVLQEARCGGIGQNFTYVPDRMSITSPSPMESDRAVRGGVARTGPPANFWERDITGQPVRNDRIVGANDAEQRRRDEQTVGCTLAGRRAQLPKSRAPKRTPV